MAEVCSAWLASCFLPVAHLSLGFKINGPSAGERGGGDMENGNLSVVGGEFNPVLISTSGISFAKCFDTCQHEIGRVCCAQGRAAAGRSLGHSNVISENKTKQNQKRSRMHEFQKDQKEEGKELWSLLPLLLTLCVSGLLICVKSHSPSGSAQRMPKRIMALLDWLKKSKQGRSSAPSLLSPLQPCWSELCACTH